MLKYWCALIVDTTLLITPVVISFKKQLEVVKTKRKIDGMMVRCHRQPEARKGPGLCGALAGTGKTIKPWAGQCVQLCPTILCSPTLSMPPYKWWAEATSIAWVYISTVHDTSLHRPTNCPKYTFLWWRVPWCHGLALVSSPCQSYMPAWWG